MNKSRRDLCFQLTGSAMERDNTARKYMPESVISESDVGIRVGVKIVRWSVKYIDLTTLFT